MISQWGCSDFRHNLLTIWPSETGWSDSSLIALAVMGFTKCDAKESEGHCVELWPHRLFVYVALSVVCRPDPYPGRLHSAVLWHDNSFSKCIIASTQGRVPLYLGMLGRFCGDDSSFWDFQSNWVPILYLSSILFTPSFCTKNRVVSIIFNSRNTWI